MHVVAAMDVCARLAGRQHGVIHRGQLIQAGVSPMVIRRLATTGALHRLHRGVYAVGHLALPPYAAEQAALLACGEPALVSGRSALYLWGIADVRPAEVQVLAVGHHCRNRTGIRVHVIAAIDRRDVRVRHGLSVTSPSRTLIDVAATASAIELDDFVAESRARRLLRPGELEAALESAGPRRGAGRIRAFLAAEAEPDFTRSKGERRLRRLLRQARLPQPRANRHVAGHEVDFLWEAEKLVVEFDGFRFHGHRRAFEDDRRRDVDLANAGYQVLRFTWRQLAQDPLAVIAAIARALGRRGLELA
jgi:very-short-patch-repair endonuclease